MEANRISVYTVGAEAIRAEGFAYKIRYQENGGALVSFLPGAWRLTLELYREKIEYNSVPFKRVEHLTGADATLAVVAIPRAELKLYPQGLYYHRVIVTSPDDEVTVLINATLKLI